MSGRLVRPLPFISVLVLAALACGKSTDSYPDKYSRPESAAGAVGAATMDSTRKAGAPVPKSVDAVGTHGEDLYDEVKAGNWKKAGVLLDSLRVAIGQLPTDIATDVKTSLSALVDSLSADITGKRRTQGMVDANRVTLLADEMVRPYASPTPVQVMLLDYDGRELEIWSAANDTGKLAAAKRDLRKNWDDIRAEVQKRNPAQAERTETLVARIEHAKLPSEVKKLATPFLDQVDVLEKVFAHP